MNLVLFACPVPTRFTENPFRWYLEHLETASNPRYVEWARPESLAFLFAHLALGLLVLAVAVCAFAKFYVSNRAKMTSLHRWCISGVMLMAAIPLFFFFWNGASQWQLPHVSAKTQLGIIELCYALAVAAPLLVVCAAFLVIAGNRRRNTATTEKSATDT